MSLSRQKFDEEGRASWVSEVEETPRESNTEEDGLIVGGGGSFREKLGTQLTVGVVIEELASLTPRCSICDAVWESDCEDVNLQSGLLESIYSICSTGRELDGEPDGEPG
jgi:hypothetical protein